MGPTRNTCCNMELRTASRTIGIVFTILDIIGVAYLVALLVISVVPVDVPTFIAPIVCLIIDATLVFGVQFENECLVLVWLLKAVLTIIMGPIAIMFVLYKFHEYGRIDYAHLYLAGIIGVLIGNTVLFVWLFGIVKAYFRQLYNHGHLKSQQSNVNYKI